MKIETLFLITLACLAIIGIVTRLKKKKTAENNSANEPESNIANLKDVPRKTRKRFSYIIYFRNPQCIGAIVDFHRRSKKRKIRNGKDICSKSFTIAVKIIEKLADNVYGCEPAFSRDYRKTLLDIQDNKLVPVKSSVGANADVLGSHRGGKVVKGHIIESNPKGNIPLYQGTVVPC